MTYAPRIRIGRKLGSTPLPLVATLDEIRLTVGAARNMTLTQTAPWPNPGQADADSTDIGWVDIHANRTGYTQQTKRFTVTKAKQGIGGSPGTTGTTGTPGATGPLGPRGPVNIIVAITGSVWSDAAAVAALLAGGYGPPQALDIVTEYNSSAGFTESRFYDGSAWLVITEYLNGNLFVNGTIGALKIVTESITATQLIQTAALITEHAQIGALVVQTAHIDDLSVSTLKIGVDAVSVPVGAVVNDYSTVSVTIVVASGDIPAGRTTVPIVIIASADTEGGYDSSYNGFDVGHNQGSLSTGGNIIRSEPPDPSMYSMTAIDLVGAGTHTYTLYNMHYPNTSHPAFRYRSIVATLGKR